MSDSEDDKPLAARNIALKQLAVAPKIANAATSSKPSSVSASNPQDAIKSKAAQKAPVIDTSDSEEDKPLLTRAKPAVRPGDHCSSECLPCKEDCVCWSCVAAGAKVFLKLAFLQALAEQSKEIPAMLMLKKTWYASQSLA